MRPSPNCFIEPYRQPVNGASTSAAGNNGVFLVPCGKVHLRVIASVGALPREWLSICERDLKKDDWLKLLLELPEAVFDRVRGLISDSKDAVTAQWFVEEAISRVEAIQRAAGDYTPWLLPEFAALRDDRFINLQWMDNAGLQETPDFIDQLANRLNVAVHRLACAEHRALCERLSELLPQS